MKRRVRINNRACGFFRWMLNELRYELKKTMLTRFCERGNFRIVKFLLKLGFNLNRVDGHGNTPLQSVVMSWKISPYEKLELIKLLASRGANLEQECLGKGLLDYVIETVETSLLDLLVDNGFVDLNRVDGHGNTPLWAVVKSQEYVYSKVDLISVLVKKGVSLEQKCLGKGLLDYIIDKGEALLLSALVRRGFVDLNRVDENGRNVLWKVVDNEELSLLSTRLFLGVLKGAHLDINSVDNEGKTVLWQVVEDFHSNEKKIMDILGKLGIDENKMDPKDVNEVDEEGRRLMQVLNNYQEKSNRLRSLIDELVKQGVDVDKRDKKDRSLLEYAIDAENTKLQGILSGYIAKANIHKLLVKTDIEDFLNDEKKKKEYAKPLEEVNIFESNTKKICGEIKENSGCVEEYFLDRVDKSKNLDDLVVVSLEDSLKRIEKGSNKGLKVIKKDMVDETSDITSRVLDNVSAGGKIERGRAEKFANSSKNYYRNRVNELQRFFDNPDKQGKWKDRAIQNVKVVLSSEKGLKILNRVSKQELRKNIADFVIANIDNVSVGGEIERGGAEKFANSSKNYYRNRVNELQRFFDNPDKQGKWKDRAIQNVKVVLSSEKGLKILNRVSKQELRKNIADFVSANIKIGKLANLSKVSSTPGLIM